MKDILKKNWIYIYIYILILIKLILFSGLNIQAIGHNIHDDYLMVDHAMSLLNGNWQGDYTETTLVKGMVFPLFLAINYLLNIPYLVSLVCWHAAACFLFICVIRKVISNKILLVCIFTILFWDPGSLTTEIVLRVYRNSVSAIEIIFLLSFYIGMILSDGKDKLSLFFLTAGAGISLALFWNTREDAMWILPAVMVFSIFFFIKQFIIYKNKLCCVIACILFPIAVLNIVNLSISYKNLQQYGVFARLELVDGNFPLLMKTIYSVEPSEIIERTSVPKSTVDKLYIESETFSELKPFLDRNYGSGWDVNDGQLDGEIKDGWFFWCLRECLYKKYGSAIEINEACKKMANEIKTAEDEGRLPRRKGIMIPSALISPYRSEYFQQTCRAMLEAVKFLSTYRNIELHLASSIGTLEHVRNMELLTKNNVKYDTLHVRGWLVSKDDMKPLHLQFLNGNYSINQRPNLESADVYNYFVDKGEYYNNAKLARFDVYLPSYNTETMTVNIIDNQHNIDQISFKMNDTVKHKSMLKYELNVDKMERIPNTNSAFGKWNQKKIVLINKVVGMYQLVSRWFAGMALMLYAFLLVYNIYFFVRKHALSNSCTCLGIATVSFVALMSNIAGIAYTHISAFPTINVLYLSASYPLLLIFIIFSFIGIFDIKKGKMYKIRRFM